MGGREQEMPAISECSVGHRDATQPLNMETIEKLGSGREIILCVSWLPVFKGCQALSCILHTCHLHPGFVRTVLALEFNQSTEA